MNFNDFTPSLFPIDIAERGSLSSEKLRAFIDAASSDMSTISNILNEQVLKVLNTLVENGDISTLADGINGTTLYVDPDSTVTKDGGVFYHPANNRPLTIHETLLLFIQILANTQNGLKEGLKIGSVTSPTIIEGNGWLVFDWPYFDGMFEALLYETAGDTTLRSTHTTVSVNYSDKTITITNTSGSSIAVYGYIWHPVFNI